MQVSVVCIALVLCRLSASQTSDMQEVSVHGTCNFAKPTFPQRNEMRASILIPKSPNPTLLNNTNCNVWYNSFRGILRLGLQQTSNRTKSSLIIIVMNEYGVLMLSGYVTEAEPQVTYPFHICPSLDEPTGRNYSKYSLFLSAPSLTGRISSSKSI